jgi:hypothetical protein
VHVQRVLDPVEARWRDLVRDAAERAHLTSDVHRPAFRMRATRATTARRSPWGSETD